MTEPLNPLRPTLAEGVWTTTDRRFFVCPYRPGSIFAGFWLVECHIPGHYRPPTGGIRVRAADRDHAQQVVDQITWAMTAGARPAITTTPTKGIL